MSAEVELAAPGAGVPLVDRLVGRTLIGWLSRTRSSETLLAGFARSADRLATLAESAGEERASRPVLVPRMLALEDSSRRWSAYMVLAHLELVDRGIAMFCEDLAADREPEIVVDIGSLKPDPATGSEIVQAFRATVRDFESKVAAIPDMRTRRRWLHPWFKPFDAKEWLTLAHVHHGIHLRQMKAILGSG
ncbi:MAG: hypothetical protein R3F34_07230 [Planctomycetota bacterium]